MDFSAVLMDKTPSTSVSRRRKSIGDDAATTDEFMKKIEKRERNRPASTTRIPKLSAKPKKGILKRSGSVSSPRALRAADFSAGSATLDDQALTGSRERDAFRTWIASSGPSTSSTGSKIPKLSVTWWETSSAYGDMTPSRSRRAKSSTPPRYAGHEPGIDEEDAAFTIGHDGEDAESIVSSCGGSSIAGTWWFGRDTRFVPHCDKRHTHDGQDFLADQYLTPTQRKNREIAELKRQLRSALKTIEAKNERLLTLEYSLNMFGPENLFEENGDHDNTVYSKIGPISGILPIEPFAEPEKLSVKAARKIRQLDAKTARKAARKDEQKQGPEQHCETVNGLVEPHIKKYVEASTLTDSELFLSLLSAQIQQELQAYKYESVVLRNRVSELEFLLKKFESTYDHIQSECPNPICEAKLRNLGAQIEAYKVECYTWRTKASECDILLKQERMEKSALQQQIKNMESQAKEMGTVEDQLQQRRRMSPKLQVSSPDEPRPFVRSAEELREFGATATADELYQLESELEISRKLIDQLNQENDRVMKERARLYEDLNRLNAENDEQAIKILSLSDQMEESRHMLGETEDLLHGSELALQNLEQQLSSKRTELEVAQLSIHKLKSENEKLTSERATLEEKLQTLESAMIESGVSIGGPSVRRRASRTPSAHQIVFRARDIQTDLNYREQLRIESDLKEISERYTILKEQHDAQVSDLEERIKEISTNLTLKNNLVNTLTSQIQLLQDEIASLHSSMQRERQTFNQQQHELNLIAQRVPFLEKDVSTAREEMLALEQEYAKERERFEKVLESSMNDTLKSQQETSMYFRQRLENAEKSAENYKNKLNVTQQELSDERMRSTLRRVELEQQLKTNLNKVENLQSKLFADRRHVEVQAEPELLDKAVLCYVRVFDKETEIPKDDLYDEKTEQLKVLQGELHITRRQVEVLQEKLVTASVFQQQLIEVDQQKQELISRCSELQRDCEDLEAKRLIERNDFESKYRSLTEENERMAEEEEQKYHALETEFDNVRQEMDEVIKRYETKKAEMKARLESLEKDNNERLRLQDDVLCLRQNLELLESNFDREKMALLQKERELEMLRTEMLVAKKSSAWENPLLESGTESLSIDNTTTAEIRRQLSRPGPKFEQLRETDIIGDTSASDDAAISELSEISGPIGVAPKAFAEEKSKETSSFTSNSSGMITAAGSLQSFSANVAEISSSVKSAMKTSDEHDTSSSIISLSKTENRDVLVQSIQAQTHLLQNLRAELESEHKKHHYAKASLYERIQKLAKENSSAEEEISVHAGSIKESFESCIGESIENLLPKIKSPSLRDTVIDMKAKLLYLVHENQELTSEMKNLKLSVYDFVSRRNEAIHHKEETSKQSDTQEDSSFDFRKDLETLMVRFDLGSVVKNEEQTRRLDEEALLMKWLRQELTKEKCELDVLVKWYESDKARLELEVTELKICNESFECERNFYKRKYESTLKDLEDVGRELTFYKQESSTIVLEDADKSDHAIRRFHSEGLLCAPSVMARKRSFKDKLRKTTKDLFGLERKFTAMEKERREVAQELDMLRGEFVMFQIQQQFSKGEFLTVAPSKHSVVTSDSVLLNRDDNKFHVPLSVNATTEIATTTTNGDDLRNVKISRRDFELMKKQLYHAEQAAARLDTEASHWQNEIAKLKDSMKRTACGRSENVEKLRNQISLLNAKLISTKKAKDKMILECRVHMSELTNQLIRAEHNADSLEHEVSRYGEQCLDLKNKLHTTAGKQQEIIHMQQKEIEDLKGSISDLRSQNEFFETKIKEILEKTSSTLDEHEANETETVVDLLNRLHEKTLQTEKLAEEINKLKDGYDAQLSALRAQYESEGAGARVEAADETGYLTANSENDLAVADVVDLPRQLKVEQTKSASLTAELEELRLKFDEDRQSCEHENANLRQRLLGAALSIEVAEKNMNVENALETVELLHSKLATLTAEMEQRESKHQEMYALMFQKGQLSARAEFFSAGFDTGSSSSTEWIFEKGGSTSLPSTSQQPSPSVSATSAASPPTPPTPSLAGGNGRLNDDEVRLRFLRDSVYYFLMGRDTRDHLQAIMSILKFSERQRTEILQTKGLS